MSVTNGYKIMCVKCKIRNCGMASPGKDIYIILENEKFFELKSKEYRDDIKKKRQDRDGV